MKDITSRSQSWGGAGAGNVLIWGGNGAFPFAEGETERR